MLGDDGGGGDGDPLYTFCLTFPQPAIVYFTVFVPTPSGKHRESGSGGLLGKGLPLQFADAQHWLFNPGNPTSFDSQLQVMFGSDWKASLHHQSGGL